MSPESEPAGITRNVSFPLSQNAVIMCARLLFDQIKQGQSDCDTFKLAD